LACFCIGLVSLSFLAIELYSNSVNPAYLYIFVYRNDDETVLTRTPNLASSMDADLVSMSKPALDMQYEINPGYGLLPFKHDMLTMQP